MFRKVVNVRKIEIIARFANDNGIISETTLMTLSDEECWKEPITSTILFYPGLEIRLHQRRVLKDGKDVHLSRYEYGVLIFLAQHPGTLFSKEQIYEEVWHESSESCLSAITNTVSRIRKKIETDKDNPVYIKTISNLGYVFAAEPLDEKE